VPNVLEDVNVRNKDRCFKKFVSARLPVPVKKILRDPRAVAVARLHRLRQAAGYWMENDGLPIPPQELRWLVSGDPNDSKSSFSNMGRLCTQRIVEALKKTGVEIDSFDAVLDFGCGCGRTNKLRVYVCTV